jgi:hypothetical protein
MCIKFFSKRNDEEAYLIPMKDETMLSIGMISMALGILIGRFTHFEYSGFSISDFLEGVLVGLSITMNLAYLIRLRTRK